MAVFPEEHTLNLHTPEHRDSGFRCRPCRLLAAGLAVVLLGRGPPPQANLPSNPTYDDTSISNAGFNVADVHAAFQYAATEFQNLFSDSIHVNINVGAGPTGLGGSSTNLIRFSSFAYTQTRNALINDQNAHPSADG